MYLPGILKPYYLGDSISLLFTLNWPKKHWYTDTEGVFYRDCSTVLIILQTCIFRTLGTGSGKYISSFGRHMSDDAGKIQVIAILPDKDPSSKTAELVVIRRNCADDV